MPSLVSLAEDLLAQAREIDEILVENKIPQTSFDEDTLELLPGDAQRLRLNLLDTAHNFRQLLRGARLGGLDLALSWTDQVVLRIVWKYKLASAVPVHGGATYGEISTVSGLSEPLVVRAIRAAMSLNIFDQSEPGRVRHTAISRLLATDDLYYNSIGLQVEDLGPASLKLIEAWEKFGDSGEPERSAFSLHNDGQSLFAVLAQDKGRALRFNAAMKYSASASSKDLNYFNIVDAYDWSSLDRPGACLVDLGGGHGQVSQSLARQTQDLIFVVQDLPHVVEQARRDLPPEFSNRISFEAQDFLQPQAPRDGLPVTYLISRCLHNWSDHYSAQILRSLVPGLQRGSRVLIWDSIIEDHPVRKVSERINLQQDFIMATIFNGKDRTVDEFRQILEMGDPRFAIESTARPEGSNVAMIEVSWNE